MTVAARLVACEVAVAKLADRRGAKVSTMLREARQRAQAGEAAAPVLHDLAELERQAKQPGVLGAMAKARLRLLKDPALEGMLPLPPVRKDGRGRVGAGGPTRSTGALGQSEIAAATVSKARIDAVLGQADDLMLKPAPAAASLAELLARQVEVVEAELRRLDYHFRSIGWDRSSRRPMGMAEQWAAFAGKFRPVEDEDDGDEIVREALKGKRASLVEELRRLRALLTRGEGGGERRGGDRRWRATMAARDRLAGETRSPRQTGPPSDTE